MFQLDPGTFSTLSPLGCGSPKIQSRRHGTSERQMLTEYKFSCYVAVIHVVVPNGTESPDVKAQLKITAHLCGML